MEAANTINDVLVRLDAIGSRLDQTSQQLYQVLLEQAHIQIVKGFVWTVMVMMISVVAIFVGNGYLKKYKTSTNRYDKEDNKNCFVVCYVIAFMIFVCSILIVNNCILDPWLNPRYWAFQQLMYLIKK